MGIQGLLPLLKSITKAPVHVSRCEACILQLLFNDSCHLQASMSFNACIVCVG